MIPWIAMAAPQSGKPDPLGMFIPFILVLCIMYFFIFRPNQRKQRETQKMLDSLKKNDRVITSSGIYGTIVEAGMQRPKVKAADFKARSDQLFLELKQGGIPEEHARNQANDRAFVEVYGE